MCSKLLGGGVFRGCGWMVLMSPVLGAGRLSCGEPKLGLASRPRPRETLARYGCFMPRRAP